MAEDNPRPSDLDEVIAHIYDELNIRKWAQVASRLHQDYSIELTAKQCRDRYQQFMDPLTSPEWTPAEELQLYHLHNAVGNKWALIASSFPGKTDNLVKNHFYSKLRKALRYLNRVIRTNFRREFKEIKITTGYKIIEAFQQQFKQKPIVPKEVSAECGILKDALIQFADLSQDSSQIRDSISCWRERAIIQKIVEFNRNYRKKSKKQKRQSLQLEELFKPSKRIQLILKEDKAEDQDSQFQKVDGASEDEEQGCFNLRNSWSRHESMKQEKDELRKSPPIYVIYKQQQAQEVQGSAKSGIDVRLSDIVSSSKMDEQSNKVREAELGGSGGFDPKFCFGFMRGESSFRSYRSQSVKSEQSKTDMFAEVRISSQLKEIGDHEMENQRDESLFRSQK